MPQIAPPTQPTVSVQVPVPTPVEPAPQSQPAAARPNQDFLDGYAAALQQQGKGKGKDEEPPADPDAKPAAVSLPPQQPDTDRRPQVVPHTLIFPYLPPPRKRFRPQARYARASEFTRHPEYHALLSQITPWDKQNDAGDVGHGVLADWLEERGFPAVARHIRESAALAPEMPGDISPRYGLPGRTQVQPGQPVMDTLHSPSTGKARIVLRLPDKYTPAGDATRMIGVDRRWVSHYMTPAEAAKRVREMGREGVALFRHSTGPGAFGPGGVRHINTDAKAAKRMARPLRYSHEAFARQLADNRFDHTTPLVFADYLEEQGLPGVAEVLRRRVEDSQGSGQYAGQEYHPARWTGYHVPPDHPIGVPTVFTSGGWHNGRNPEQHLGFGVLFNVPGEPHYPPEVSRHMAEPPRVKPLYFGISTTPEDALRLLEGMPGVRNADRARDALTHLAGQRKTLSRKRKYAAQRAWATWQSLHPEIRHTPLGAALVHVANGHGGDETATHLAYAAVHAAGEHDSPMKLEPIGVLADYLEDNNPGHPLARAFNLNGITNKLELDRLVEAHAAQMAAGEMGVSPGHDWTRSKLSEIRAGHPLHTRQGPPNDLQRAVAAVHAAGFRASDDDVYRSASRVAQRRYKNTASSQAIWHPDDYHAAIGRQVMGGHDVVEANDPNRFARAVAASIGAKK